MGQETAELLEELDPNTEAPIPLGAHVAVNPLLPCGGCSRCVSGNDQLGPRRRILGVTLELSSAYADYVMVPAAKLVLIPSTLPQNGSRNGRRLWSTSVTTPQAPTE